MSIKLKVKPLPPPPKLRFLYDKDVMDDLVYIILKGGRGGGKTETLAQYFVLNALHDSSDILCLREVQNTIEQSVYKVIESWIDQLELRKYFHITEKKIICTLSGAEFTFLGMTGRNKVDNIKSLHGIKYVWYEEAHLATKDNLNTLLPTIRVRGLKFFFSLNEKTEKDAVIEVVSKYKHCKIVHINYTDNPHCPQELITLAEECKRINEDDYKHIWLGKPVTDKTRQTVLPMKLLKLCVDAHSKLGNSDGHSYAGLDLASGELKSNDKNALSVISGCVVRYSSDWQSGNLDMVARRVADTAGGMNVVRLYYDAVGVGGFAGKQLMATNPDYSVEPLMGQQVPFGKDRPYMKLRKGKITNRMFFRNLKSQLWWNLRLRAENTARMLNGFPSTRKEYYLSFDSGIDNLQGLLDELAQATWIEDSSGRIQINKSPGDYEVVQDGKKVKMRSPNRADSVNLAFARSIQRGLKANM